MAKPAAKKTKGGDAFKQMPFRASPENWKRLSYAKVEAGTSFQRMMFDALNDYLRKRKLGELEAQGEE